MASAIWCDIRFALRNCGRYWLISSVSIVTLALGISVTGGMFNAVEGFLLRPLPLPAARELVAVAFVNRNDRTFQTQFSYQDYLEYSRCKAFRGLVAYGNAPLWASLNGESDRINGVYVSPNYLSALGVRFALGTGGMGAGPSQAAAVISYRLWQRLGASHQMVGGSIELNDQPLSVIGVTAEGFTGLTPGYPVDVWVPIAERPVLEPNNSMLRNKGTVWLTLIGRLGRGFTGKQAAAALNILAADLRAGAGEDENGRLVLLPGSNGDGIFLWQASGVVEWLIYSATALLLVMACANTSTLEVARTFSRRTEMAVREALGASRGQLVRMQVVQTIVLAGFGGAGGLLGFRWFSRLAIPLLVRNAPDLSAAESGVGYLPLLAFTGVIVLLAGLVSGLLGSLALSKLDLTRQLKQDSTGTAQAGSSSRAREMIVAFELFVSVVLLAMGGLLAKTVSALRGVNPGFNPQSLVYTTVVLKKSSAGAAWRQTSRELCSRLREIPGVGSASFVDYLPIGSGGSSFNDVSYNAVGPAYVLTMGMGLVQGRDFSEADMWTPSIPVIVNEALARRRWPGGSALGRPIRVPAGAMESPALGTVVGVAANSVNLTMRNFGQPHFYIPMRTPLSGEVVAIVRGNSPSGPLLADVTRSLRGMSAYLDIYAAGTMSGYLARWIQPGILISEVLGACAGLGALLAFAGIFGIAAVYVASRTQEFGIRLALGARKVDIVGLVVRRLVRLVAWGAATGVAVSAILARVAWHLFFGTGVIAPALLIAVPAAVLLATVLLSAVACWAILAQTPLELLRPRV